MVGSRLNVHLYRDSFNTPWGFRLQGGKDLNQPLIVQRVFSNSPAEGELQRGDVILSVNNRDAAQLTHKQAQDLIKHGGGQVQLVVNRPPPGTHVSPLSPPIVTQKPRAPSLQQPPSMPSSAGYQPKKITLNKLGGGGPEFGSDFSHRGVDGYGQTAAQRYEPQSDKSVMLNRVQSSLDNIALSPRTPDVQSSSPFYQGYDPQPYQPAVQPYQPPPTQVFTPTGLLLENQRLQEQQDEGEAIVPVWERRKHFQQRGAGQSSAVRTPANKPPPRVPKPQPGPTSYGNFGVDYSRQKSSNAGWRPAPAYKPTPAPASPASYSPAAVTYAPKPAPKPAPQYSPQAPASWQQQQPLDEEGTPAWRNTLKSTGVKPWEQETGYALPKDPVRSVPYSPQPGPHAGPFSPTPAPGADVGGSENGPKVVHLQYNSPMGLYSSQNVAETLHGQTQALSGQTTGSKPSQPATNDSGERDWSQSAVLRFINQEDSRVKPKQAPAVSPKPKVYSPGQQQQQQPFYQEVGVSDF
ncbi:LIM domain-binding protein 3-like isoform X6 [Physella acuta]|uniref:LIM domain-binding protein 3-like isoform X6 n=1 Tax=Physella acuta TaxID=109671 RepID=UPI0027DC04B9|nr:LIM domain-binding protein 3-like isoform X6 [Physella acuta]